MKHPTKNIEKKVAIIGCLEITRDFILGLARQGYYFDHCITYRPTPNILTQISGYCELKSAFEKMSLPVTELETYNMQSENDRKKLLSLEIDIAIVYGWQRLIPKWFLDSLSIGAYGTHGSGKPLPYGRGRSPVNWSILQGKGLFFLHLFEYAEGVDNGPIAAMQKIEITPFDTCQSLLNKCTIAMKNLCINELPKLIDGSVSLRPQNEDKASYYPKRSEADGIIFWEDTTTDIYNLIRAVTMPYPGAFSFLDNDEKKKVLIWRASPFDAYLDWPLAEPGEIVEVFNDGTLVVKTGDSSLLVLEIEGYNFSKEDIGKMFGNANIPRKTWADLPE